MSGENLQLSADALTVELWGRVIHGFDATNRRIHAATRESASVSEAETQVLLYLYRQPGQTASMAQLARAASFSSGGFTKLADKLTRRGLVQRKASSTDRRVIMVEFTDHGREVAAAVTQETARITREVFVEVLGEDRAAEVSAAMTALYRANTPPAELDPGLTVERPARRRG